MDDERRVVPSSEPIEGEVTRAGWAPTPLTKWTFRGDDLPNLLVLAAQIAVLFVFFAWIGPWCFEHLTPEAIGRLLDRAAGRH